MSERFGHNLRVMRERRGLQQSDVAARMREQGHRWHQSTVAKTESGTRVVSFDEAAVLAVILDVPLVYFTLNSEEAAAEEAVYTAASPLARRYEDVAEAVERLLDLHETAFVTLGRYEDTSFERVREAVADVRDRMGQYGLDPAIAEGVRRFEERRAAGDEESGA